MGWFVENISPLYRTDAKPRVQGTCTLYRGAKEEDQRSKGVWGIGNTLSLPATKKGVIKITPNPFFVAGERLICASLDEPLPPETAQRFKSPMLRIYFCFTACVCK